MDDDRTRRFWERTLRDIEDDGFFAPVQTAEPPTPTATPTLKTKTRPRITNLHLVLIVTVVALVLAAVVFHWLAPALIF